MDLLIKLFTGVLLKLPPDTVKLAMDRALDVIEDSIAKSPNKVDDGLALPAIQWLRQQLDVVETPGSVFEDKNITKTTVTATVTEKVVQ